MKFQMKIIPILLTLLLLPCCKGNAQTKEKMEEMEGLLIKRNLVVEAQDVKAYLENELEIDLISEDLYKKKSRDYLNNKYHLAMAYFNNRDLKKADKIFKLHKESFEKVKDKELKVKYLLGASGIDVIINGESEQSKNMLLEIVSLVEPEETHLLEFLIGADDALLGMAVRAGDSKEIEKRIKRILSYVDNVSETTGENFQYINKIIMFYLHTEQTDKGISLIEIYVKKYEAMDGQANILIYLYGTLKDLWWNQDIDKSFDYLKKAEKLLPVTDFPGSINPGAILFSIGKIHEIREKFKEAREYYTKSYNAYQKAYDFLYPDALEPTAPENQYNAIMTIAQNKDDSARHISRMNEILGDQ